MCPRFIFFPSQAVSGGVPVLESYSIVEISSAATSKVATAPSGIANNDILIIILSLNPNSTDAVATSTGFTNKFSFDGDYSSCQHDVLWKRASSESGNYTVNWSGSAKGSILMLRVSGCVSTGDPFDVVGTGKVDYSAGGTPNDITSTQDDTLAISIFQADTNYSTNGTEVIAGTGWAHVFPSDVLGSNSFHFGDSSLQVGVKDVASTGAVGSPTFELGNGGEAVMMQTFNLKS